MKKTILFASILALVFFIAMWFAFPFVNNGLLNHMKSSLRLTEFSSVRMNSLFILRWKTASSFGILPLFSLGIFTLIRKTKNREYASRKLMIHLGLLIAAYFIGFYLKFQLLFSSLKYVDSHPVDPSIRFDKSIDSIYYYDYPLIGVFIGGLIAYLVAKRKQANNQLLDS